MTLDTLSIVAIVDNLKKNFINSRINKIQQPEYDEILLNIRSINKNQRLVINVSPANPLIYIDNESEKINPKTAMNFCMSLRKHILNGKIVDIIQVDHDRVIEFHIENYDELGDSKIYRLIVELMGKHSNIILVNSNNRILESIKHIDASTSSVRQVFPGANYFRVFNEKKVYPLDITKSNFVQIIKNERIFYNGMIENFKGISPKLIFEICNRININAHDEVNSFSDDILSAFFDLLIDILHKINNCDFSFNIYLENNKFYDHTIIEYSMYDNLKKISYDDIFILIKDYFIAKINSSRMYNKTELIRTIVNSNIKRVSKKLDIWDIKLKDCEKMNEYKLFGELLLANSYLKSEKNYIEVLNYYNNTMRKINIDNTLSMASNSQKYYNKYNKLKRTKEAINLMYPKIKEELNYLQSISQSIKSIENIDDFNQIVFELTNSGYLIEKRKNNKLKKEKLRKTFTHYIDDYGYEYFIGKNNIQNEYITFTIASSNDWWFHIKNQPGSHVIVKNLNESMPPDEVFINAASLAAYYSKVSDEKIEIDYTQRKNLKKPKNGHIGTVIYHTNYSIIVSPKISSKLKQKL